MRQAQNAELVRARDVAIERRGVKLNFTVEADGKRRLACEFKRFEKKLDFSCDVTLDAPIGDNITVAVPFKRKNSSITTPR